MEALRKLHNGKKRELIKKWVGPGSSVLDCGCGRGGDWHKWKAVRAHVTAIDPDTESLKEAASRANEMGFPVRFLDPGDIRQVKEAFDVVCYNFSLHYIVDCFEESLDAIALAVKPGGLLIGIVPDQDRAEFLTSGGQFKDPMGNTLEIKDGRLWVSLTDGPFYAEGPKSEPLLNAFDVTEALARRGFQRVTWEPMLPVPNGHVSDLYSSFVFRKNVSP